jgi:hypothetical protein
MSKEIDLSIQELLNSLKDEKTLLDIKASEQALNMKSVSLPRRLRPIFSYPLPEPNGHKIRTRGDRAKYKAEYQVRQKHKELDAVQAINSISIVNRFSS